MSSKDYTIVGTQAQVPWLGSKITGRIQGYLAKISLQQKFINKDKDPLECIFHFPLPVTNFHGAICGITVTSGDTILKSEMYPYRLYWKRDCIGDSIATL
jgi:hypothetical protein